MKQQSNLSTSVSLCRLHLVCSLRLDLHASAPIVFCYAAPFTYSCALHAYIPTFRVSSHKLPLLLDSRSN